MRWAKSGIRAGVAESSCAMIWSARSHSPGVAPRCTFPGFPLPLLTGFFLVVHWAEDFSERRQLRAGKSRPTSPCGGPRMNPSLDDGSPPRPLRRFRVAEHGTQDLKTSRAPVHSVLVQK